jgi:hypothetical protein
MRQQDDSDEQHDESRTTPQHQFEQESTSLFSLFCRYLPMRHLVHKVAFMSNHRRARTGALFPTPTNLVNW